MGLNGPVSGEKVKAGPIPVELARRQNGPLTPYPCAARRISPLPALNSPCGEAHHDGLLDLSGTKSGSRRARTLNVDWS